MTRDLGRGQRARRSVNADPRFRAGSAVVAAWTSVVTAEPGSTARLDAEIVLTACLNELARAYQPVGGK